MTLNVQHHQPAVDVSMRFSKAAQAHILHYLDKQPEMHGIRFSVKKTGCSGLSYVVEYIEKPGSDDVVYAFEWQARQVMVCIDKKSYPFLRGCEVDYVKQGLNANFTYKNPNQTGQCGCGESFTVS